MGNSWTLKNSSNGLPAGQVQQIIGDSYGIYTIIGGNAMVSVGHGQTWSVLLKHDIPDFNSIAIDNGKIYLGYDGGMDLYNCKEEKGGLIYVTLRDGGEAISKDNGKTFTISNNLGYASYSTVYYLQANQWWGSYLTTTSIPYTLGIDYNYASYYTLA